MKRWVQYEMPLFVCFGSSDTETHAELESDQHQEVERPQRSDAARAKRTPSVEAYLDQELLDWLWQIETAAVARRQRFVASAAIRLALRQLKKRMSPEEVVKALLSQEPDRNSRRGRPQR